MKSITNSCDTCGHCYKLYRLFALSYSPFTGCYCDVKDEILNDYIACEDWQRRVKSFDFSPQRFDKAEEDIKFLLKVFENAPY